MVFDVRGGPSPTKGGRPRGAWSEALPRESFPLTIAESVPIFCV